MSKAGQRKDNEMPPAPPITTFQTGGLVAEIPDSGIDEPVSDAAEYVSGEDSSYNLNGIFPPSYPLTAPNQEKC